MTYKTKYQITNEAREFNGRTIYRIKALRDIPQVSIVAGDLGGWIESESNLSQIGQCWVGDEAIACGTTRINCSFVIRGTTQKIDMS